MTQNRLPQLLDTVIDVHLPIFDRQVLTVPLWIHMPPQAVQAVQAVQHVWTTIHGFWPVAAVSLGLEWDESVVHSRDRLLQPVSVFVGQRAVTTVEKGVPGFVDFVQVSAGVAWGGVCRVVHVQRAVGAVADGVGEASLLDLDRGFGSVYQVVSSFAGGVNWHSRVA
jgi:hypothetical protein